MANYNKAACFRLGYPQLDLVDCKVGDETVYLRGTLSSYYLKQLAQSIVVKIPGVHNVVNEIKVGACSPVTNLMRRETNPVEITAPRALTEQY